MKNYRSLEMLKAHQNGGFRERFAMDNGHKQIIFINGEKCYKFTYSSGLKFQAGNGATYNTVRNAWID